MKFSDLTFSEKHICHLKISEIFIRSRCFDQWSMVQIQTKKGIRGRKPASKKHLGWDNAFVCRAFIQGSLLDWKIDVEINVEICMHHKCGEKALFLVK